MRGKDFLVGLLSGVALLSILGFVGPRILGGIKFKGSTGTETPVSATNPLPMEVISGSVGGTSPSVVIQDTVQCDDNGEQLPSNAVEPGAECCISLPPTGAVNSVLVGNNATITLTNFTYGIPPINGAQWCQKVSNCNLMFCRCIGCTQDAGIGGEGD